MSEPTKESLERTVERLQDAVYHHEEVTAGGIHRCDYGLDSTLAKEILDAVAREARLDEQRDNGNCQFTNDGMHHKFCRRCKRIAELEKP